MWIDRLLGTDEGRPRLDEALEELWPYALGVLDDGLRPELVRRVEEKLGRTMPVTSSPSPRGRHEPELAELHDEMTLVRRSAPAGRAGEPTQRQCRVAAEVTPCGDVRAVWGALAEIPDPEIPVISIVDLGVVAGVRVDGERVEVDFTPTFMGCPALDTMRRQMEDAVRALGAEPVVHVVLDDSWSTDRISPEGREKLRDARLRASRPTERRHPDARAAGARPVPLPMVRLDRHAARERLRPDPVPLAPLLQLLPPAVRAVQDDLMTTGTFLHSANQPPPLEGYDLFSENRPLVEALRREGGGAEEGRCAAFGRLCGDEPLELGRLANEYPPVLRTRDRFGERIDEVEFHPSWHELLGLGVEHGLHSLPWREPERPRRAAPPSS